MAIADGFRPPPIWDVLILNLPGPYDVATGRARLFAIFAFLILLVSNIASVQVHRDVGHGGHFATAAGAQDQAFVSASADDCPLCSLSSPLEPILPYQAVVVDGRITLRATPEVHEGVESGVRPVGHGWRSRAPPGTGIRPA